MKPLDLESLREVFKDKRIHMALGTIESLAPASDRSALKVRCTIFPELNEIVAVMTWEHVGPDAGIFGFPVAKDLVLIAIVDGDFDQAFVIKRLTSKVDKIPMQALDGHSAIKALAGKNAHLISDTAILLGRGGSDPTQPLVLGTVFKTAYSKTLDEISKHKHIGNLGYLTGVPDNAVEFTTLKASPVDDSLMLSDISKTEK